MTYEEFACYRERFEMNHKDKYHPKRLHAIMAGDGKPYAVLTPIRKQILRAFHDGLSVADLSVAFNLSEVAIHAELSPLVGASLLRQEKGIYQPTFLIVDEAETQRVFEHAHKLGKRLSDCLLADWKALEARYGQLTVSRHYDFHSLAFFLIGSIVLDVGLLAALARDQSLMPPKPHRPSPDMPKAH